MGCHFLLWLRFYSGAISVCSCLQCPQLSELLFFLLWELSVSFYKFCRHRVGLVDHVDLICSLYSSWEGFGSSLAKLLLVFNCGFISISACGSSTEVCSWGCIGGLGSAPVSTRCGGGAATWVAGVLAAPGTQGSWWLGQEEIQCSRRVWQPISADTLQYSCLENPPDRDPQQATVHKVIKSWTQFKWPCVLRCKVVFFFFLPVATLPQWGLSMKMVQLLGLQGPWWSQGCKDTDCLHRRIYVPIRLFFQASCSRGSEGLFGQSFSIALPVQAVRGLPSLGSFSVLWHVLHIERPSWLGSYSVVQCIKPLKETPWVGSYSVVQCVRCLMGQTLYCPAVDPGLWRERGYGDGSTPYAWLSRIALLPWLPGFPPQAFPTHLLPHIPLIHLSAVNSSPCTGIAPQSLNSSFQPLCLLGDLHPCSGCVWLRQGLSESHSI